MRKEEIQITITEEIIIRKIYSIRGKQVMLSQDLADLYEVETKILNQQVKRNIGKFPERYMFQLTREVGPVRGRKRPQDNLPKSY